MNRASWQSYDDVESLCLQIELGNRHTVMLIYPTNGDPPSVRLWEGSGEHPYGEDTLESFRAWLAGAEARKPS